MSDSPNFLQTDTGRIAYHHHAGTEPGIMFLGGFMSDMEGGKAVALEAFAREKGWQFTRMDYGGHGQSSGTFAEGTIGLWLSHAKAVFEKVTTGPQILVGSSMGGWMMLLLALAKPKRIAGLVGIASAPDFTENLIWNAFSPTQREEMDETGRVMLPNCMPGESSYPITQELIEEARNHLLMHRRIPIHCPVRLIHGMEDADVPWRLSMELADRISGDDVAVSLVKNGDHRMSKNEDIALIKQMISNIRHPA